MNIFEMIMVFLLTCFDRVMNLITFGRWERNRGDEKVNFKIRNQV
jgi:hypothetical protein